MDYGKYEPIWKVVVLLGCYFFFKNNELILLNGFMKKTQKTPKSELDLAKKRKREAEND